MFDENEIENNIEEKNENENENENIINNENEEEINNLNNEDAKHVKENINMEDIESLVQDDDINEKNIEEDHNNLKNNEYKDDDSTPITVQPVKFSSFDNIQQTYGESNKNLDLLLDIKLQLAVELGRCELPIKKVLELTRGSIIELDKVAGEPVELFANGKLVAHGEVVVIEDNFGLRITSITEPEERIKNL